MAASISNKDIQLYSRQLIRLYAEKSHDYKEEIDATGKTIQSLFGDEGVFMVLAEMRTTGHAGTAASCEGIWRWWMGSEIYWLSHDTPLDPPKRKEAGVFNRIKNKISSIIPKNPTSRSDMPPQKINPPVVNTESSLSPGKSNNTSKRKKPEIKIFPPSAPHYTDADLEEIQRMNEKNRQREEAAKNRKKNE